MTYDETAEPVGAGRAATSASDEAARLIGWKGNEELWRRQNLLGELNDFIAGLPGIDGSGYIQSVNDPDRMATTLQWHGAADPIQQAIKDEARRLGITVAVEQRRYGRSDLERAADALVGLSGSGLLTNFSINYIAVLTSDFDGVIVVGEHIHPITGSRAAADSALAEALTSELGIPVAVEAGAKFEML
ncbi:hypothetical protein [Actinoplanes sp. URMC 104]|uniref:hypothetical protein n=1 Tax=Actinoplanes sp. URMC 104 TaxID=3423409 RepID=UPI003F1AB277